MYKQLQQQQPPRGNIFVAIPLAYSNDVRSLLLLRARETDMSYLFMFVLRKVEQMEQTLH